MEDIFNLKSLVSLNFTSAGNLGGTIPDRFDELEKLTTINLNGMSSKLSNPPILPDSLFESKTLTSINLYKSNVSGKVKIPNIKNIRYFNIHTINTNKIHTDLTEIEISPTPTKRFTFSGNHITDLTIDEFNHLEKLSKINKTNVVLFDSQTKTYAAHNYKYGDNVLLTHDSMFKTLFALSNSNPSRVDLSIRIKNDATNRFYNVDKDDYNLFITAKGIRLPKNLLHIMKDNIDHVGGNSLIVTVNNTMLKKSKFTFPFNVDASMTREVNVVDSTTNEIIKSLDNVV